MSQREVMVFPGHPVFIALQIMDAFPSYSDAISRETASGYSKALTSCKVNGAGSAVVSALFILESWFNKEGKRGEVLDTPDKVFDFAARLWHDARSGGDINGDFGSNFQAGVEQAERQREEFIEKLSKFPR